MVIRWKWNKQLINDNDDDDDQRMEQDKENSIQPTHTIQYTYSLRQHEQNTVHSHNNLYILYMALME